MTKLAALAKEVPAGWTDPSGVQPNTLDWPLDDLANAKSTSVGNVVVVEGADLDTLRPSTRAGHPDHAVAERRQDLPTDLPTDPAR